LFVSVYLLPQNFAQKRVWRPSRPAGVAAYSSQPDLIGCWIKRKGKDGEDGTGREGREVEGKKEREKGKEGKREGKRGGSLNPVIKSCVY